MATTNYIPYRMSIFNSTQVKSVQLWTDQIGLI